MIDRHDDEARSVQPAARLVAIRAAYAPPAGQPVRIDNHELQDD